MIGVTLLVLGILILTIWIVIEVKRLRHKMFAIFLICLLIFLYASGHFVFKGHEIDYGSVSGLIEAGGLYFAWLGSLFTNVVSITSHAVQMDWATNSTDGGGK